MHAYYCNNLLYLSHSDAYSNNKLIPLRADNLSMYVTCICRRICNQANWQSATPTYLYHITHKKQTYEKGYQ